MAYFSVLLVQFALSNLAFALPLCLLAWYFQTRGSRPFLAHLLWLVVLAKLVTPPFYSFSVPELPGPKAIETTAPNLARTVEIQNTTPGVQDRDPGPQLPAWQMIAVGVWLLGSAIVLVSSVLRARRFDRLLNESSRPAPETIQRTGHEIGETLGLKTKPKLLTTAAAIPPMAWWIGGSPRIYIPRTMAAQLSANELRAILAHEMGHLKRGDHFVRWLECIVCVVLWWNPIAWWARRNLRVCEEICCDAFVLSRTAMPRDVYAGAFVSAIEFMAVPTIRPLGLASHAIGGSVERRIRMMLSGKSIPETPAWIRGAVIVAAAFLVPLGLTFAQQDVAGKWHQYPTSAPEDFEWPDGVSSERQAELRSEWVTGEPNVYEFSVDGNVLNGTITWGSIDALEDPDPATLLDGRIEGNELSFRIVAATSPDLESPMIVSYSGVIENDEITLTVIGDGAMPQPQGERELQATITLTRAE